MISAHTIALRGQAILDRIRAAGNTAIGEAAEGFDANPRRFDGSRRPIDRTSVCLDAWNNFEWDICHATTAAEWLLEGKSLSSLFKECETGREDWRAHNFAYEIVYNKPRG